MKQTIGMKGGEKLAQGVSLSRTAVQDKAAPRLGQIAASYHGRPLSRGGGRIGSLRAGDRVPDVHLPEGRLYDLLDDSTLTLFISDGAGRMKQQDPEHRVSPQTIYDWIEQEVGQLG